jgi:hypothetical protein
MINQEQVIACPVCSTKIPFDANQLMIGVKFQCPNQQCDASIGLAMESKPVVEEALEKFNEMKGKVEKK